MLLCCCCLTAAMLLQFGHLESLNAEQIHRRVICTRH